MAGLSPYERGALLLTGAFTLFSLGWFFRDQTQPQPYTVTTVQSPQQQAAASGQDSSSDWPESLLPGEVIDLNTADLYDLDRLPGIGPTKAQAILDYRDQQGPFTQVDQLLEVSGIGSATLEGLRPYVTVS